MKWELSPLSCGSSFLTSNVAILCCDSLFEEKAKRLSSELNVSLLSEIQKGFTYLIEVSDLLELRLCESKFKPLSVNFSSGLAHYRARHRGTDLLIKAIGSGKKVFDATAGLGKDSFVLASYGNEVWACEKSKVVAALLKDGLERALRDEKTKSICEKIHFKRANSIEVLAQEKPGAFDCVYIDSMFPETTNSAAPKKDLQILRALFQNEGADDLTLLNLAQKKARRVVVKRPLRGDFLGAPTKLKFEGGSIRFDVYIQNTLEVT